MRKQKLEEFRELVGELQDLNTLQGLIGWDLETYMPPSGSEIRGKQMATLSKLSHNLLISNQMTSLLDELRNEPVYSGLSRIDKALVREVAKEHDRARKLPVTLVQEMSETTTKAHGLWVEARKTNRFDTFAPILEHIVSLNRQMAEALGYQGSPYNALLDLYEPELTTVKVDALFATLRKELVPLVKAIMESPHQPGNRFLKRVSDIEKQRLFSEMVIQDMGFDFSAGRLDKAPHPFCMGMGPGDVRLTTRFFRDDLVSSLFSSMHEAGHGLYEQGIDPALARTPLSGGASLGIHESQSRLWENIIGRSRPFWKHYLPKLRKAFPRQLQGVTLERFYRAINLSRPTLIRVEADEATYNLHIMLRYEIERELIEGKLAVKEIPEVWSLKMQEYLGIVPDTDSQGVLQDVHWSHGSFGYFPTYTLGNLYSVQFFNMAKKAIPNLEEQISHGRLQPLKSWLNQQIHQISKVEMPDEIVLRVTEEPLNADYFIQYLWEKYGEIYQIERSTPKAGESMALR